MGLTTDLQRTYNGPTTNIHYNPKKAIIMKKYIFLPIAIVAAIATILFTSCTISVRSNGVEIEAGEKTTETRNLEEFNQIRVGGNMNIEFVTSDSSYIEIEAGKNILPHIKTEINDKILKIKLDNKSGNPYYSKEERILHFQTGDVINEGDIKVKVFAPTVEELHLAGAVDFKSDSITSEKFVLEVAGRSDTDIKSLSCKNMKIDIAGSSDMKLKVNGAQNVELSVAGQSDADITFDKCNRAGISIAGAADIKLKGTLNILDKHIAGAASINTDELKLTNNNNQK